VSGIVSVGEQTGKRKSGGLVAERSKSPRPKGRKTVKHPMRPGGRMMDHWSAGPGLVVVGKKDNDLFHRSCPSPPGLSFSDALGDNLLLSHFKAFLGTVDALMVLDFTFQVDRYHKAYHDRSPAERNAEGRRIYETYLRDSRDILSSEYLPRLAYAKTLLIVDALQDVGAGSVPEDLFDEVAYLCTQVLELIHFRTFFRSRNYIRYCQQCESEGGAPARFPSDVPPSG